MRCQKCGLRDATVTLIQTKDGKRHVRHICHSCAEEETFFGQSVFDDFFENPFADLFGIPSSRSAIADRLKQREPKQRTKVKEERPSKTPFLDQFSRDLTALAKTGKLDPLIGRSEELNRILQILSRRTKNNPILIGEPGVGK